MYLYWDVKGCNTRRNEKQQLCYILAGKQGVYGRRANGELEDLVQKIHILDKNLLRIPTSIL